MTDTRTRILDLAEGFTQERGFAGFSYLNIAKELDVTTTSIHYHFKAKADLAVALVERLNEAHRAVLVQADQNISDPKDRLRALISHFEGYVRNGRICMCGMMAAEFEAINQDVRKLLKTYFRDLQNWIVKQLSELRHPDPVQAALLFVSGLEGVLLLARLEGDPSLVGKALNNFVA